MDYDPNQQRVTFKQILAGWLFCLTVVGLALTTSGYRNAMSDANTGGPPQAVAAICCPINGARLPSFSSCAPEERGTVRLATGPSSLPANPCS
jgi:hypothetical protein